MFLTQSNSPAWLSPSLQKVFYRSILPTSNVLSGELTPRLYVCVYNYVCVRSCMHGLCMFVCMYYLDNHYSAVFSTAQIHCLQENLNDVKGIKNKTLVSTARVSRKNPLAAPADTKIPSNGFTFRPDSRQEPNSKKFNSS